MDSLFDSIKLYFKLISISLRSQMQYRASFVMMTIGNMLVTFIEFITILVLFDRFGSLKEWTLAEVSMFYGLINVSFALSETFDRGFDMFALQVTSGEFDRTLLRPRTTGLQVLGHDFPLFRLGRLAQGLLILVWGAVNAGIAWDVAKIVLLGSSVLGGVAVFTGLIVLQAAACFWSTQSLEIMNSFTYGGVESFQFPASIFPRWFARLFIFVIPLACVSYFPMLSILEKPDVLGFPVWFGWVSPGVGLLFLALTSLVWKVGVRHYRSTGS